VTVSRRVGELAEATRLTVRTLHYYEQIGLLKASERSTGGHRLYAAADVERLYRICLLRRLGLPLADIGHALDDPAWNLRAALGRHLADLDVRIEAGQRLRSRVADLLDRSDTQSIDDRLMDVMGDMSALDRPDFFRRPVALMVYADVAAAYAFLVDVFGLGAGSLTRGPDGAAVHGEVHAGDGVIWLHPERSEHGLASPRTVGASTGGVVVLVDDVDAHHRHAAAHGATIDYEPVDQPYGYREYSARDPEGGLWSFMKPLDTETA
jgi:MerR family transcriptional regulator, thiopeptide resistance regulator